jgi:hypothetical protein
MAPFWKEIQLVQTPKEKGKFFFKKNKNKNKNLKGKAHDLEKQDVRIYGPRPKSGKSRLNLHGTILEGNSIGSNPQIFLKKLKQKKAHDLENQDAS